MKHSVPITAALIMLFLLAQVVGLLIVDRYVDREKTTETGQVVYEPLPFGFERPDVAPSQSYIFIILGVLIGTGIFLVLIKFKKINLWKLWFFLSVTICLGFAFSAFVSQEIAIVAAIILAGLKAFKPNVFVHNITELFIYGGLAAIFVPMLNLTSAFLLLFLISLYDFYAVRQSKHMITLAKFQASTNVFAGLFFPKSQQKPRKDANRPEMSQNAILGGGDIAFPLLFAGVVMKQYSLLQVMIIPLFAAASLAFLFLKAEKGKFYPAMPILSLGCLLGYAAVLLVG